MVLIDPLGTAVEVPAQFDPPLVVLYTVVESATYSTEELLADAAIVLGENDKGRPLETEVQVAPWLVLL